MVLPEARIVHCHRGMFRQLVVPGGLGALAQAGAKSRLGPIWVAWFLVSGKTFTGENALQDKLCVHAHRVAAHLDFPR
jgi:hypothetical protein